MPRAAFILSAGILAGLGTFIEIRPPNLGLFCGMLVTAATIAMLNRWLRENA